jgi:hypothetical protein
MFFRPTKKPSPTKGQSTLEYTLVVTAVISVIISLCGGPYGLVMKAVNSTYSMTTNGMTEMSSRMSESVTPTSTIIDFPGILGNSLGP